MSKAEEYSFNIPSELFQQLTKEQQVLWRKEIENTFNNGYHQAEKDLELTWEDVKEICDITFEEACRLQRNMKGSLIYKKEHYQIVLKRFKDFKERKEK